MTGMQQLSNPLCADDFIYRLTSTIPCPGHRAIFHKEQDNFFLLLHSLRATAPTATGVLNGKVERG